MNPKHAILSTHPPSDHDGFAVRGGGWGLPLRFSYTQPDAQDLREAALSHSILHFSFHSCCSFIIPVVYLYNSNPAGIEKDNPG